MGRAASPAPEQPRIPSTRRSKRAPSSVRVRREQGTGSAPGDKFPRSTRKPCGLGGARVRMPASCPLPCGVGQVRGRPTSAVRCRRASRRDGARRHRRACRRVAARSWLDPRYARVTAAGAVGLTPIWWARGVANERCRSRPSDPLATRHRGFLPNLTTLPTSRRRPGPTRVSLGTAIMRRHFAGWPDLRPHPTRGPGRRATGVERSTPARGTGATRQVSARTAAPSSRARARRARSR